MSNGLTIRLSVASLEQNPPGLAALRDAYGKMQQFSPTDNRSWIYWSGIHGFPQWYCWHHGRVRDTARPYDLFLPWHRAYLLYFEHAVRDQNSAAAIPWWDWVSRLSHRIGLPKTFSEPAVGGQRNPLYNGPVPPLPPGQPARYTLRFPDSPARLPTKQQVEFVLSLTSFVDFSNQLQDIHDGLHGWTGGRNPSPPPRFGDMGTVVSSAFDPIFWSHHGMIDRLWYRWQLRHGINNIPPDYLDKTLEPFGLTVADVLDINRLGYEYAQSVGAASVPGPS